jgi:hypothetical protein
MYFSYEHLRFSCAQQNYVITVETRWLYYTHLIISTNLETSNHIHAGTTSDEMHRAPIEWWKWCAAGQFWTW